MPRPGTTAEALLFAAIAAAAPLAWFLLGGNFILWIASAILLCVALHFRGRAASVRRWLQGEPPEGARRTASPPDAPGLMGELSRRLHRERIRARATEREARARAEEYERSAQALPDGIVILDADMYIRWSNRAAQRLLGLRDPEDRGLHIDNLVRHPDFARYRREPGRHAPEASIEIPAPALPDHILMVSLVPFSDGQHLLLCRDVTERARTEAMRRDFVNNISHELRTPITVLCGYLEMVQEAREEVPERWRQPMDAMHEQAERLRQLVEDLLLLSRIEARGLAGQPTTTKHTRIDMVTLIEQLQEEARVLSGKRAHRIEATVPPNATLLGNEPELRAAFSNLVRNAVQYTPPGGRIHIEWRVDEAGDAWFIVTDEGDGIEPEHISRLTERFYRVDEGRSREEGGTGLGLAIVKHALTNYGADLEIHSEPGTGSRFACHFPAPNP